MASNCESYLKGIEDVTESDGRECKKIFFQTDFDHIDRHVADQHGGSSRALMCAISLAQWRLLHKDKLPISEYNFGLGHS